MENKWIKWWSLNYFNVIINFLESINADRMSMSVTRSCSKVPHFSFSCKVSGNQSNLLQIEWDFKHDRISHFYSKSTTPNFHSQVFSNILTLLKIHIVHFVWIQRSSDFSIHIHCSKLVKIWQWNWRSTDLKNTEVFALCSVPKRICL